MGRLVFIGILMLGCVAASAQDYHFSLRNYKAIDGLPQSQVNIILEDNSGYLWIGTHGGGLARFDGREFKVYTTLDGLLSNIVTYLKLDSHQNLWIIHPRGMTKFDGVTFKKFQQPGIPSNAKRIRRAFELNDTLFVLSTPGNLGKIYKDSIFYWNKPMKRDGMVAYCHLNPNKDIMLYLNDSSFLVRSASGKNNYVVSHRKVFNRLYQVFNYKDVPWMMTDSGYYSLDMANRKFEKRTLAIKNDIVYYDQLHDIFWTRHENDLLKEQITAEGVVTETVLKDIEVSQVLVDLEGNTWFATNGSGLFKYYNQDFDRCSSEKLRAVMAIHKDHKGATWIGTMNRGLYKIKDGKITEYLEDGEEYRKAINCIIETPDGTLWVGTNLGLGKYNEERDDFSWFTREEGGLSNSSIFSLDHDEKGNLWIGTYGGGVDYYDGKTFRATTMKEGLSTNTVMSTYYSPRYKKLFIGNEFGLSTIYNDEVTNEVIPGIENTSILSIHPYQDSLLLIGTGGAGFVVYNPDNGFRQLVNRRHGLTSDFIYFAAADEKNYIWVGTEKGINRIKLDKAFEVVEGLHYDYDNGLIGVETNQNSFYLSKDEKYFGLIDGLYEFNDRARNNLRSFDLHLTNVEIHYGQFPATDYADSLYGFFKIPYNLQLPPDKNHITFQFNRVDKRYPKSVKFKYMLDNFDNAWSQPSSANKVTYTNLPPGNYILRVMATNNEGSWAEMQIAYPFTVKTPYYQSAAFIVGMFLLIAGMITLALYLRVKQKVNKVMEMERIRVREQETLRREIARDFHDEMGNQLTRIINYISLLKLNGNGNGTNGNGYANGHVNGNGHGGENGSSNGNGSSHDLYTKVENSAKYLYTGTRDFIWSIDPGNDELSKLFIHIRDFGEKLFEEKNMNFRAYNEIREKVKLPYGFSREANLIFKEAMTNAFKYSEAGNVSLTLKRTLLDEYEMSLEDDGVGFFTDEIQKSNGLKNIRERADRVNAVLRITSEKNHGAKIVLTFKLNKTLKYGLAL